jgi:hypothetical protein
MTRRWVLFVLASSAAVAAADPRHTTEAVTIRKKPGEKEAAVAKLAANTPITVLDEEGRWLRVRAGANEGYVLRTSVNDDTPAPDASPKWGASPPEVLGKPVQAAAGPADVSEAYTRPAPGHLTLRGELGLGYRSLGMDHSSNAEGGLTNYLVDADAVAVVLDGGGTLRLAGAWFAGFDAHTHLSLSSPGIDYPGPTASPGKIPFTTFAVDVGARLGLRVRDIDLAARIGGHYDAFLPKSVDNAGMLPRERLLGLTAGVRADFAPAHSRFGASARFDVLALGSRAQTPGLEDGTSSTAHALWGGLSLRYLIGAHVAPFLAYDFGRATTSWTGPSVREPGVTNAHRTDTTQLLELGVGGEL